MQSLYHLRESITNLWEEFGQTESALLGLAINTSLTLVGVAVYLTTDGLLAFAGAVWAILHILAIARWGANL